MIYWISPSGSLVNPSFSAIAHLALVPAFCLYPALISNLLILSFDLSNDTVQVQIPIVVHLEDNRCIRDLVLQFSQFLTGEKKNRHLLFAALPMLFWWGCIATQQLKSKERNEIAFETKLPATIKCSIKVTTYCIWAIFHGIRIKMVAHYSLNCMYFVLCTMYMYIEL